MSLLSFGAVNIEEKKSAEALQGWSVIKLKGGMLKNDPPIPGNH
jgi:hypothetical protein